MVLSTNFSLKEFTKSPTATRKGISNEPYEEAIENIKYLVTNLLQPVRTAYGSSIRVNSGFRSLALNTALGGAKSPRLSQHCEGLAADIDTVSNNSELFEIIKENYEFDQLIWEFGDDEDPDWVHVSLKKTGNRNQILRAKREERPGQEDISQENRKYRTVYYSYKM